MGWRFPWVSAGDTDFAFDFGFAMTDEQMASAEFRKLVDEPPDWLTEWASAVGTELRKGLVEGPGWDVFVLRDGVVYHTYSRHAPDGDLLAPFFYQLLDQVPSGRGDEVRMVRHDEYDKPWPSHPAELFRRGRPVRGECVARLLRLRQATHR